jgi:hypothetical protein
MIRVEDGSRYALIFIVALRVVYGLQFGAALSAGPVNGCEFVQGLPLQIFARPGGFTAEPSEWVGAVAFAKILRRLYESEAL